MEGVYNSELGKELGIPSILCYFGNLKDKDFESNTDGGGLACRVSEWRLKVPQNL